MRALKTKIRGLSKPQFERLKDLTHHAKNLYNQTLWTLRQAYSATGLYFSYEQMNKAMKQVENLEGEVNYKLLKAKVAQQTLRKLDKNFKSFFKCHQDFQKSPGKYKGKPSPPKYKKDKYDNLIFDYQAFAVKNDTVLLEKGLEIKLPKLVKGQKIQQVEIIPKPNCFHAVFVYEENPNDFKLMNHNDRMMSIDLGLNNLATCVTNGVIEPFIIDGRRIKSINAYYNKRKAKMQSSQRETGQKMVAQVTKPDSLA